MVWAFPSRSSAASWPPPCWSKPEIAKVNFATAIDDPPELAAWDDLTVEETGDPCPKCGSLEMWWDFDGDLIASSEPIRRAMALADLAARIRSRKP